MDEAEVKDARAGRLEVRVPRKRRRMDSLALPATAYCRTCHRMVRLIDEAWAQLAQDALYYPGLNEVSEFTCAWRAHGMDTMGSEGWLQTNADISVDAGWLGWPELLAYHDCLPNDFLQAWRHLNPGNSAVRKASALLQESWYEARLYPYDWDLDRQPCNVLSWQVSGPGLDLRGGWMRP